MNPSSYFEQSGEIAQDAPTGSLASLDELLATVKNPWVACRIVERSDNLRLFVVERFQSGKCPGLLPFLLWVGPEVSHGAVCEGHSCVYYRVDDAQVRAAFSACPDAKLVPPRSAWVVCGCQGRFIE